MKTTEQNIPENLIKRPDGTYVAWDDLKPQKQLAHELAHSLVPQAIAESQTLKGFKSLGMSEVQAYRKLLLDEYGVNVGGKNGGLTIPSIDGRYKIQLAVNKTLRLGPEIEAAKELIDTFLEEELDGSKDTIRAIVTKVFKVNKKGRLDTYGILGLREHKFDHPLWLRAMKAIDDAIIQDQEAIYLYFFETNPGTGVERRIPLEFSGL